MLSEGLVQNLRVPTFDITLFFIALLYNAIKNNKDNEDSKDSKDSEDIEDNVIRIISWVFFLTKHVNSPGTRLVCQFTQEDRIARHNSRSASILR